MEILIQEKVNLIMALGRILPVYENISESKNEKINPYYVQLYLNTCCQNIVSEFVNHILL